MFPSGAQVGNQARNFFQTDANIQRQILISKKQKLPKQYAGYPVDIKTKILSAKLQFDEISRGVQVVLALADGRVAIYTLTGDIIKSVRAHSAPVTSLDVLSLEDKSQLLVTGSWDKSVKVFQYPCLKLLKTYQKHQDFVKGVVVCSIDKQVYIYSSSSDKTILKYSYPTETTVQLKGHKGAVNCILLNPTSQQVITGSSDRSVKVWSMLTNQLLYSFDELHTNIIYQMVVLDNELYTASADNSTKRLNLSEFQVEEQFQFSNQVKSVCFLPQIQQLIVGEENSNDLVFCKVNEKEPKLKSRFGHFDSIVNILFDKFNLKLISFSLDGTIRSWDIKEEYNGPSLQTLLDEIETNPVKEEKNSVQLTADELKELEELME